MAIIHHAPHNSAQVHVRLLLRRPPTYSLRTPYVLPTYSLPTPYGLPTCARLTGVPQAVFIMSLPETTRASPKSATLMVRARVRVHPLTLTRTLAPNP